MNNFELSINLYENSYFQIKLLEIGFITDGKWREEPDFDMLDHICTLQFSQFYLCVCVKA